MRLIDEKAGQKWSTSMSDIDACIYFGQPGKRRRRARGLKVRRFIISISFVDSLLVVLGSRDVCGLCGDCVIEMFRTP